MKRTIMIITLLGSLLTLAVACSTMPAQPEATVEIPAEDDADLIESTEPADVPSPTVKTAEPTEASSPTIAPTAMPSATDKPTATVEPTTTTPPPTATTPPPIDAPSAARVSVSIEVVQF